MHYVKVISNNEDSNIFASYIFILITSFSSIFIVVFFLGATELFGCLSALDMNMPIYGGEMQVPTLGIDLQCFDSEGKCICINQRLRLLLENSVFGTSFELQIK